jgi:hypothetical protein
VFTRFPSISLTKMIKKTLIVTTDTLSKFSLTKLLMENFDSDNGPLVVILYLLGCCLGLKHFALQKKAYRSKKLK